MSDLDSNQIARTTIFITDKTKQEKKLVACYSQFTFKTQFRNNKIWI